MEKKNFGKLLKFAKGCGAIVLLNALLKWWRKKNFGKLLKFAKGYGTSCKLATAVENIKKT